MARADAEVLGLIGTGGQARTQAMAVCTVRGVNSVLVYGRDAERRRRFCGELSVSSSAVECYAGRHGRRSRAPGGYRRHRNDRA